MINQKRLLPIFLITVIVSLKGFSQQQPQIIADCTIYYNVTVQDPKADPAVIKSMAATAKTLYIKGAKSRTDLETPSFKQAVIYDSKTDSSVILRELGNNKYISYLNGNQRKEKNKKYEGIKFTKTDEKKTILGYECNKVVASLTDGSSYDVFYTTAVVPSVNDYEYQFRDLPGLVLEYEANFERDNAKVIFTASKITLVPVPVAKFDIPKAGYRVL